MQREVLGYKYFPRRKKNKKQRRRRLTMEVEIISQEGKTLKTFSTNNPDEILEEVLAIFKNDTHIILSELTNELYVIYDGTEDMNVLGMVKVKTNRITI